MAKQTINLGTAPTGAGGDTNRAAFTKTQANIDEIYSGALVERGTNANGSYSKFPDGTLLLTLAGKNSPILAQNGPTAVTMVTPTTLVGNQENAMISVRVSPVNSNDHYGAIGSYIDSPDGVTIVIRNGAVAQVFVIQCTIITRWK